MNLADKKLFEECFEFLQRANIRTIGDKIEAENLNFRIKQHLKTIDSGKPEEAIHITGVRFWLDRDSFIPLQIINQQGRVLHVAREESGDKNE